MIIRLDTAGGTYLGTPGKRAKHGVAPPAIGVPAALRPVLRIPARPRAGVGELPPPETANCLSWTPFFAFAAPEAEVRYGK